MLKKARWQRKAMMVPAPCAAPFYGRPGGYRGVMCVVGSGGVPVPSCCQVSLPGPGSLLRPRVISSLNGRIRARRGPGGYCRASGNQGTTAHLPAAQEATPGAASRRGPTTGATKCKMPHEGRSLARPPPHEGKTCLKIIYGNQQPREAPSGGDPLARPPRCGTAVRRWPRGCVPTTWVTYPRKTMTARAVPAGAARRISSLVIREAAAPTSPQSDVPKLTTLVYEDQDAR